MSESYRTVELIRLDSGRRTDDRDRAATEEPLQICLHGRPFAVVMRTPGADVDLAAGFLFSEGVIRGAAEIGGIERCRRADDAEGNRVDVRLAGDALPRLEAVLEGRRRVTTGSSCGLCGRRTIESLRASAPPIAGAWTIDDAVVQKLAARLRDAQPVFAETGGLHAAGLFDLDGALQLGAEDVGRHNAVDKVVGHMLLADRLPLDRSLLFVSGRSSFEIVQKAYLAGIPLVASVSAPSTLAIDLARDVGMTLLGFVRGGRSNLYSHPERVAAASGRVPAEHLP